MRKSRDSDQQYAISIKLSSEEYKALEAKREEVHERAGIWVAPTTLVRSWITDQLGIKTDGQKRRRARSTAE